MRQAWVPRARFEEMISEGAITDDSTVAAYALLLLHERAQGNRPNSFRLRKRRRRRDGQRRSRKCSHAPACPPLGLPLVLQIRLAGLA